MLHLGLIFLKLVQVFQVYLRAAQFVLAAPLVAPQSGADIGIGECPVLAKVEARSRLCCAFGERLANLIHNYFLLI